MVIAEPTEASPLLKRLSSGEEKKEDDNVARTGSRPNASSILERLSFFSTRAESESNEIELPELPPFSILMEVIGARHLCFSQSDSNNNSLMETYCVVQYGTQTVHRTLPFRGNTADQTLSRAKRFGQALKHSLQRVARYDDTPTRAQDLQNPIWTLQHNALWSLDVTPRDVDNHKAVVVNLWAKPLQATDVNGNVKSSSNRKLTQPTLLGKVKIHLQDLVAHSSGKRMELPLVDNLDREVTHTSTSGKETKSLLAFRCRIASPADLEFTHQWNDHSDSIIYRSNSIRIVNDNVWNRAQVIQLVPNYQNAILLTEKPENQVQGASLSMAVKNAIKRADGKVCVKPGPDPLLVINNQQRPKSMRMLSSKSSQMYLTSEELRLETLKPSRQWVQAGSREQSLGRLYVEILSCHDLPNVDIGESLGNKTDAFVNLLYGDTMVQTDLIDDELSPHWMPWTQRAFAMNMSKDWPNPYSQVLYIGVFGYKRKPHRRHKPVGRIEIHPLHFQRDTLYELEYNLYKDSHKTYREAQGRIRLRLRIEMDDERAALLSSLSSSLPWNSPENASIYINVKTKKSWAVAQFTACGEYDNGEKFALGVLQGYIDEIVQGYLRRLLYSLQDGTRSLVFWQPHNQFQIPIPGGVFVFPLYSLLCFIMGLLMVEHPQFIPGMLCLAGSLFLLAQMGHRNRSPSPWKRCNSFGHYWRILLGQSTLQFEHIHANEGWEETRAQEEELKKRVESDQRFCQKKEAVEKRLEELEQSTHMDTKSKDIIHLELLVVLGKVQAIIGDACRVLRFVDTIITWDESDLAFLITVALMALGTSILFLPWAFLLHWTGRILVVLLLGPQNRLIDVLYIGKHTEDEQRLHSLFEKRWFSARCHIEETTKMKVFRQTVFGRYGVSVPSILWTPHKDCPLHNSTATYKGSRAKTNDIHSKDKTIATAIGQLLFGEMIPRPQNATRVNHEYSTQQKETVQSILAMEDRIQSTDKTSVSNFSPSYKREREASILLDAGFEVGLFDEEAQYLRDVLNAAPQESTNELGVEVMKDATSSKRFLPAWKSVHDFDELKEDDSSSSSSSGGDRSVEVPLPPKVDSTQPQNGMGHQSVIEFGVEVSEQFKDEAMFAQQSWRSFSCSNIRSGMIETSHEKDDIPQQKGWDKQNLIFVKGPLEPNMGGTEKNSLVWRQTGVSQHGIEITEEYEAEDAFTRQPWRFSLDSLPPNVNATEPLNQNEPGLLEGKVDDAEDILPPNRGDSLQASPDIALVSPAMASELKDEAAPEPTDSNPCKPANLIPFDPHLIHPSQSFSLFRSSSKSPKASIPLRASISLDQADLEGSCAELGFEVVAEWIDDN